LALWNYILQKSEFTGSTNSVIK